MPAESLSDPALAPALAAAALQTLQCGVEQYAATAGMLSGEYLNANGFVDNHTWEWRGVVEIKAAPGSCNFGRGTTAMGFYTPLQQARFQLDDAFNRLDKFTDAQVASRASLMAQMRAYAGYADLLLGEGMCEMTMDNGPKMTREQVFAVAEERFSDAITRATAVNDQSILNMARVGRARARLDLKKLPEAAADASLVPSGFVRNAEFTEGGAATRENRIYNLTIRNDYLSVSAPYRNLTVNGVPGNVPDPRVKVKDAGKKANDGVTPLWQQQKFIAQTRRHADSDRVVERGAAHLRRGGRWAAGSRRDQSRANGERCSDAHRPGANGSGVHRSRARGAPPSAVQRRTAVRGHAAVQSALREGCDPQGEYVQRSHMRATAGRRDAQQSQLQVVNERQVLEDRTPAHSCGRSVFHGHAAQITEAASRPCWMRCLSASTFRRRASMTDAGVTRSTSSPNFQPERLRSAERILITERIAGDGGNEEPEVAASRNRRDGAEKFAGRGTQRVGDS